MRGSTLFPGCDAAPYARSRASCPRCGGAPLIRDRQRDGVCKGPASAAHHCVLRYARDTNRGALEARLPLALRPLTLTCFAAEEQRLTYHGGDHGELEWLSDKERRFRTPPGEETLGEGGGENHRHLEGAKKFVHRIAPRTAIGQLDVGEDEPRPFLLCQCQRFGVGTRNADHVGAEAFQQRLGMHGAAW